MYPVRALTGKIYRVALDVDATSKVEGANDCNEMERRRRQVEETIDGMVEVVSIETVLEGVDDGSHSATQQWSV